MIHSNVFALPRPIVCFDGETNELFVKTGTLIFSETRTGKDGEKHSEIFSERPIDEKGNVRIMLDNYIDFGEPIYIGHPGETISPFSQAFIESLKAQDANKAKTLRFMDELKRFGIEVNREEVLEEAEIVFRFKNHGPNLYVEADGTTVNALCPILFQYGELVTETDGQDIVLALRKAIDEFYGVFRKPKRIVIKDIIVLLEKNFEKEVQDTVEDFKEKILHINDGKGNDTGIEFMFDNTETGD